MLKSKPATSRTITLPASTLRGSCRSATEQLAQTPGMHSGAQGPTPIVMLLGSLQSMTEVRKQLFRDLFAHGVAVGAAHARATIICASDAHSMANTGVYGTDEECSPHVLDVGSASDDHNQFSNEATTHIRW